MRLGGVLKHSLIDYPGKISCVVFLCGCNFHCPYCHNPGLVRGDQPIPPFLDQRWLTDFLQIRKEFLEGVVISGGEPTLQSDLEYFCEQLKQSGFFVKLDTNGSRPDIIGKLLKRDLVDYIAMDIKTDPREYAPYLVDHYHPDNILESIRLIMTNAPDYEFRTTCAKPFISSSVLDSILDHIEGAKRYCLQRFNPADVLQPDFFTATREDGTEEWMERLGTIAAMRVHECIVR